MKIPYSKSEKAKACQRRYRSKPDKKDKRRLYMIKWRMKNKEHVDEYNQMEYVKEGKRKFAREYQQRPDVKKRIKEWQLENKEHISKLSNTPERKAKMKEYSQRPEVQERRRNVLSKTPEFRSKARVYRNTDSFRKKRNSYCRKKFLEDPEYRIKEILRKRLKTVFKKYTSTGKTMTSQEYGIDWPGIMLKLLSTFPRYYEIGKYHIDHIRPISDFIFIKDDGSTDVEEIKKAFAPENHQWLLGPENLKKGCKYPYAVTFDQSILNSLEIVPITY